MVSAAGWRLPQFVAAQTIRMLAAMLAVFTERSGTGDEQRLCMVLRWFTTIWLTGSVASVMLVNRCGGPPRLSSCRRSAESTRVTKFEVCEYGVNRSATGENRMGDCVVR